MKNLRFKIILIVISLTILCNAQSTINGRFVEVSQNGTSYVMKAQINTNTGTDQLGTSTMIFTFDNSALSFPASPVSGTDYTFSNFSGGNYSSATVTRPASNEIWINIVLNSTNAGTVVAQSSSWTDVVTITFTISNTSGSSNLQWQTGNSNWAVYTGDNSTLFQNGTWTNLNTTPLPVELSSFSASTNNNSVVLNWQTTTELSNYGFEIQKSAQTNKYRWEKIGFVNGNGNSNKVQNYSFVDNSPAADSSFYRLRQIDENGNFKYSKIVKVNFAPSKFQLFQNYPNPFNPSTKIRFSLPDKAMVTLRIFDITGKEVATLLHETKNPGTYSLNFNGVNLSSGVYIYQITSNKFSESKKMILLK